MEVKLKLIYQKKKIYNILGNYPKTIVNYCFPKMIINTKNNKRIMWLTNRRAFKKFLFKGFNKRYFFKDN